jgi:hypothetical protein
VSEHERMIHGESETREEAVERMNRADSEPDPDTDPASGTDEKEEHDGE